MQGTESVWVDGDLCVECAERSCRICGCSILNCADCIAALGQPCSWSEKDPTVCTRCEIEGTDKPPRKKRVARSRGEKGVK